jgi:hypothetical protein
VVALAAFGAGFAVGTSRGDDELAGLPTAALFQRQGDFHGSPGWRNGDDDRQQRLEQRSDRSGDRHAPGWRSP